MERTRNGNDYYPNWKVTLQNGIENFLPYIELYGEIDDITELWNGYCNRVVNILLDETDLLKCGGKILYLSDEPLKDGESITCFHWFIMCEGKYYDASRPYGVDSILELPIVKLIVNDYPNNLEEYLLFNTMIVDRADINTKWDSKKILKKNNIVKNT